MPTSEWLAVAALMFVVGIAIGRLSTRVTWPWRRPDPDDYVSIDRLKLIRRM